MARKNETWISVKEAAKILTETSGHTVSEAYVRRLGNTGKITINQIDGRTKLYAESEIRMYVVKQRGDGSVRREARAPRGTREEALA
jgi:hypothetical protein